MSTTPVPALLAIWYAEHITRLQAALGVPVALIENDSDRDYGALPGPPSRLVLRAELVDGRTLNAYRDYSAGLPSDPDAAAGWSVCVHRWTNEGSIFEASAHREGDSPEELAAIACAAVREAAEQQRT